MISARVKPVRAEQSDRSGSSSQAADGIVDAVLNVDNAANLADGVAEARAKIRQ